MKRTASSFTRWPALALLLAALATAPAPAQERRLDIVAPRAEQTVHDNHGQVAVLVDVSPPLGRGERIGIELDGRALDDRWRTRAFVLEGLDRGEHVLRALLLDGSGRVIASSEPVRFYQWQASRLFPSRR